MTPENKKATYLTGGVVVALIAAMAILWATGFLQTVPTQ